MTHQQLLKKYDALPPAARRQVARLISALSSGPPTKRRQRSAKKASIADAPFVGMWKDREDMEDSAAWVREFRRKHWERDRD
jgi:hypothetical protein